jgi:hypothetical protein
MVGLRCANPTYGDFFTTSERTDHDRLLRAPGLIEMVIWQLPRADTERPHGLKYRLVYIRNQQRIVGYDNERGKGDHKHLAGREEPGAFVSVR